MPQLDQPLVFTPIFQERIWGGRKLAELFGKKLPQGKRIGESWEIVDRPEAQSVVANGVFKGRTLHELWSKHRDEVFGAAVEKAGRSGDARFPLLIKVLDAQETLSLQVHPPELVARLLGGEAKTEFWYVAEAAPDAELLVGFREPVTQSQFVHALERGTVADCVYRIPVKPGEAMFLPAGRIHAVGAGNVLVEIQQNSDTTYRVFDWNRLDEGGNPRQLHFDEALQSIDFNDAAPRLVEPEDELLVRNELFEIQKWGLSESRAAGPAGTFAIVCCLTGKVACGDVELGPAEFCLVPATMKDRELRPGAKDSSLLRITIPQS